MPTFRDRVETTAYSYGLTDANVAGTGRTLSLFYEKDADRDGTGIYYLDPNVRGSRIALETRYENNSDGSRRAVDIGQPFYAIDARYAFDVRGEKIDQEQGLYVLGDKFAEFAQDFRRADVSGGFSNGQKEGQVWRWLGGYTYEKRTFSPAAEGVPPDPLPEERKFGYPWLGFESVEDRFDTSFDVDRIHRIEDLNLGRRYSMSLGYSTSAFGGDDQDRLVFRSEYRDGLRYGDKHLLFYGAETAGLLQLFHEPLRRGDCKSIRRVSAAANGPVQSRWNSGGGGGAQPSHRHATARRR